MGQRDYWPRAILPKSSTKKHAFLKFANFAWLCLTEPESKKFIRGPRTATEIFQNCTTAWKDEHTERLTCARFLTNGVYDVGKRVTTVKSSNASLCGGNGQVMCFTRLSLTHLERRWHWKQGQTRWMHKASVIGLRIKLFERNCKRVPLEKEFWVRVHPNFKHMTFA